MNTLAQDIITTVEDTDGVGHRLVTEGKLLVIFGGRSEIGLEVARRLAPGSTVVLAARRPDDLDGQIAILEQAGAAAVHTQGFDADDLASHRCVVEAVVAEHGPIDTAVLAFGILGDQARAEKDSGHAAAIAHTDYVAQVSLLTVLADTMRSASHGVGDEPAARRADIVVFSSVAGVRVRRANYVYGSAKAGLDGFCSGLADALHGSNVRLVLVRPGFVIGRMTQGMSPAPFSSSPGQVAQATVRALNRGARSRTVWVPWILKPVFSGMKLMPQWMWRRLRR
ncbi:MAG: SDR family NAD(P)-dependent oxidoreductase [Actinomycetia bacterium]|nr:SDR family NAD(P)-dependent oxidoreductase [Actinomycetes bacterium]MCH9766563.1 SDR family NAD(P)-dependent oxidoreductase [Actinomycetes bacterium]